LPRQKIPLHRQKLRTPFLLRNPDICELEFKDIRGFAMTAAEWIEMFRLLPEGEQKLVIVLQNGTELCVDTLVRFEPSFVVLRGRAGGSIDESRGFFVPYDQMTCLRVDRSLKLDELQQMFGADADDLKVAEMPVTRSNQPTPVAPTDPAAASRLLLDRIRAVRATSGSPRFASQMS
jgi:hypothetical protein